MKRMWTLLGVSAVLIALTQGLAARPAEATLEGCTVTFCQKCAGDCCPTTTGGCRCVAICGADAD
jgi:hypothetical protein